jgi:hypothetical protein
VLAVGNSELKYSTISIQFFVLSHGLK